MKELNSVHRPRIASLFIVLAVLGGFVADASAATNGFVTPAWRGLPQTEASLWEIFSAPFLTNNLPNAGTNVLTQTGNGGITQLDTNAFLTGSGDIYNLTTNSIFELHDTVSYTLGVVTFQTRTIGSELDYANVALQYDLGGGPQLLFTAREELLRQAGMGFTVVSKWKWDVSALGISSFSVLFDSAASSLSFDAAMLDTASVGAVPEPSTWALVGLGSLGFVVWSRRRA